MPSSSAASSESSSRRPFPGSLIVAAPLREGDVESRPQSERDPPGGAERRGVPFAVTVVQIVVQNWAISAVPTRPRASRIARRHRVSASSEPPTDALLIPRLEVRVLHGPLTGNWYFAPFPGVRRRPTSLF